MGAVHTVQYSVMFRYIHPITKKCVTNRERTQYDESKRFIRKHGKDITNTENNEMLDENAPNNPKYDMLFIYNGVESINSFLTSSGSLQINNEPANIISEKFKRCNGEAWFTSSTHASLQSAMNALKPLVKTMGKENVRLVKSVPVDVYVDIE